MQYVAATKVCEGMCVIEDVRDEKGRILIARGQRLSQHHIVRLRKFHVEGVFIDPLQGNIAARPSRPELRIDCVKALDDSCNKLLSEPGTKPLQLDGFAIRAATQTLVDALVRAKKPLITLNEMKCTSERERLLQHSVNATVLAITLGLDLRLPRQALNELAIGMLFHDIGMIYLDKEMPMKLEALTSEEVQKVQQHPLLGYEQLRRTNAISEASAAIVLNHHELLDGSGYPYGVKGATLTMAMQIAAVADAYDALTTNGFGSKAFMPDVAISYLIARVTSQFSRDVVMALCKRIALYPEKTAVALNTGECGLVAGVLPQAPTRPVVLIYVDSRGKKTVEPLIVDLMKDEGRAVVRSAHDLETLLQMKAKTLPERKVDPIQATLG